MLKGDVFKNQIFENHVFALFINLFMNNANGIVRSYKNAMNITYSGHNVTINKGACIVQGRLLEEDSSTTIDAGIETMFCKLVVEVDLDKVNTSSVFNQGYYNIVKDGNSYPTLTQQDIVGQNSGKYQYELARFKISDGVVADFEDKRTYIEDLLQYGQVDELSRSLQNFRGDFAILTGTANFTSSNQKNVSYPNGFTKDNCVVISLMLGYQYGNLQTVSSAIVEFNDYVMIIRDNYAYDNRYNHVDYKIVLMKVS